MVKSICIALLFFFSFLDFTQGQSPIQIWNEASQLAKNGKWAQVVEIIKPHIFPAPIDSLTPWLLQLYAYSNFKNGDQIAGFVSANRILTEYPGWSGTAETNFLLGCIAFNKNKIWQSCKYWSKLPDYYEKSIINIFTESKFSFSQDSINDIRKNPDFLSSSILKKIIVTPKQYIYKRKEVLKIGIVLPFDLELINEHKSDSPPYDFYRGVLLASEVMASLDSTFEMYAFDSKNSIAVLQHIISNKSLSGVDLVIGPLKHSMLSTMDSWAKEEKTLVINPLSNHSYDFQNSFLHAQQPSFSTISTSVFEFISKISIGIKAGIIFGPEKNDSLLAEAYRKVLKKMGRELVLFKKVGKNSAANLTKFLVESGLDSTSHVFVANNEPLVRAQLPGAYSWTKAKFPVVVFGKWIESYTADYDEYNRIPFYFVSSDLPNYNHPQWNNWKESYILKWGVPPSWIAWKGFDLVISFAKNWYALKGNLSTEGNMIKPFMSELFGRYQFSKFEMDNTYVPIIKVAGHDFQKVWPE